MLTVGSLFSGIGGLELGLERVGFSISWQVECDPYAQAVLRKHWPDVARFSDVREVGRANLRPVDLICGGFPCQDISVAGKGGGLAGARSGLWREFARILGELRPRFALIENVPALRGRGLATVLGDLASLGYDAKWDGVPASALGALHRRDRLFIVAHTQRQPLRDQPERDQRQGWGIREAERGHTIASHDGRERKLAEALADPRSVGRFGESNASDRHLSYRRRSYGEEAASGVTERGQHGSEGHVADSERQSRQQRRAGDPEEGAGRWDADRSGLGAYGVADPHRQGLEERIFQPPRPEFSTFERTGLQGHPWTAEPDVGRVAHGVSSRVDRLRCLGNAVVPQVAEHVGRCIQEALAR